MNYELPKWQCSRCWREYTFEEFKLLPCCFVDINNKEKYGRTVVCYCGAIFHKDVWHIQTWTDGFRISTVHLEMESPDNENFLSSYKMRFETMINDINGNWLPFQKRYTNMQDAINGHWFVVDKLPSIILHPDLYPTGIIHSFMDAVSAAQDQEYMRFKRENR